MKHLAYSILLLICLMVLFASSVLSQENEPNHLFKVKVNGKYGFIDRNSKIVIEPQFISVDDFSDGLAEIYVGGTFSTAYIDRNGKIVIEPRFDIGSNFSEGLAWVGFDRDKKTMKIGKLTYYINSSSHLFNYDIGFIDKTGNFITEPIFSFAEDFSEGLALVRTKDDKFGFIDKTGKIVIKPKFEWASSFSEGLAWIFKNGKFGFIDKTGKIVIEPKYTKAESFAEGLAVVKIGGEVRKPGFEDKLITTTNADLNYAYIDKTGKVIFRIKAENAHSFSNGLARFNRFGQIGDGFVDRYGKVIVKPQHYGHDDFSEGLASVILDDGKSVYINTNGSVVLKPNFGTIDDFKNGLAEVCESYDFDTKCGYIDKLGNIIWKPTK